MLVTVKNTMASAMPSWPNANRQTGRPALPILGNVSDGRYTFIGILAARSTRAAMAAVAKRHTVLATAIRAAVPNDSFMLARVEK